MNINILKFIENRFPQVVRSIRVSMFDFVITSLQMTIQEGTLRKILVAVLTSEIFQDSVDIADPAHVVVVLNE